MKIGLDFDGVIVDHSEHKMRLAADFGYDLLPWQTNSNVMKTYVPNPHYREVQEMIYTFMTPKAPPIAQALDHIRELGGEPYIVSARRPSAVRFAHEWMGKHGIFDFIPAERVFFCGSGSEKNAYCRRLGIKVFLDDKINVLDGLDPSVKTFLFDNHGSTRKASLHHNHKLVLGWRDFSQALDKIFS